MAKPFPWVGLCLTLATSAALAPALRLQGTATDQAVSSPAAQKIQHVVVVMQENRSFDSYFGTYPGPGRHSQ